MVSTLSDQRRSTVTRWGDVDTPPGVGVDQGGSGSAGESPDQFRVVPVDLLDLAFRALDDAETEIESFEKQEAWYTASQKMMTRIEDAKRRLKEILK